MCIKVEIESLKEEIQELELSSEYKKKEGFCETKGAFDLQAAVHMKMVQGPWQLLGISIDHSLSHSVEHRCDWPGKNEEHGVGMTVEDAIRTAKSACEGFFDTFQKELDAMLLMHLREKKEILITHKKLMLEEEKEA